MAVTSPEYVPQSPPAPTPRPKRNLTLIVVSAIGVVVLIVAAVVITLVATKGGQAAAPAGPAVPVIENISRPNAACTPAADRKLGLGDDLSKIYWFGWLDGKQADMPVGQALSQRIAGHEVRDAWYCPPRADW